MVSTVYPTRPLKRYHFCVSITRVILRVITQKNVIDISVDKNPGLRVQKLDSQSGLGLHNVQRMRDSIISEGHPAKNDHSTGVLRDFCTRVTFLRGVPGS